jgi:NADH-quinone oxidoreductase subunit E
MVEIFKDTCEDLTAESFERILDEIAAGGTPRPGPQVDRQFSAPAGGPTTLTDEAIYDRYPPEDHPKDRPAKKAAATVPPARAAKPDTTSEETSPGLKGPKERKKKPRKPRKES